MSTLCRAKKGPLAPALNPTRRPGSRLGGAAVTPPPHVPPPSQTASQRTAIARSADHRAGLRAGLSDSSSGFTTGNGDHRHRRLGITRHASGSAEPRLDPAVNDGGPLGDSDSEREGGLATLPAGGTALVSRSGGGGENAGNDELRDSDSDVAPVPLAGRRRSSMRRWVLPDSLEEEEGLPPPPLPLLPPSAAHNGGGSPHRGAVGSPHIGGGASPRTGADVDYGSAARRGIAARSAGAGDARYALATTAAASHQPNDQPVPTAVIEPKLARRNSQGESTRPPSPAAAAAAGAFSHLHVQSAVHPVADGNTGPVSRMSKELASLMPFSYDKYA